MNQMIMQKQKVYKWLSLLSLTLGLLLIIYMISVEGEPGALPLFLIIIGTAGVVWNKIQSKKQLPKE